MATDQTRVEVRRLWRDERVRSVVFQVLAVVGLALFVLFIIVNTRINLETRGLKGGFGFLTDQAFFDINQKLVPYTSTSTFGRALLVGLNGREQKILRLRYGLDDGVHRTLEVVGTHFGLTRERIRQIESGALRKLRHPRVARQLTAYVDSGW